MRPLLQLDPRDERLGGFQTDKQKLWGMTSVGEAYAPLSPASATLVLVAEISWPPIELVTNQCSRVEGKSAVISDGKAIAIRVTCSGASGAFR